MEWVGLGECLNANGSTKKINFKTKVTSSIYPAPEMHCVISDLRSLFNKPINMVAQNHVATQWSASKRSNEESGTSHKS